MPRILPYVLRPFWLLGMALSMALACSAAVRAQDVLPVPALSARVVDVAKLLSEPERATLEQKLADFEAQAGPQIVVLLVASTLPEDIARYAQRVADSWKIGRRNVGDGILLVVARDDRKVRIEVAKALEGAVPDLAARQIIDRAITPAFKRGDYAAGLNAGVDGLIARIRGEHLPAPERQSGSGKGRGSFDWETLAIFFFVGVPVVGGVLTAIFGRKLGALVTAGGTGALAWLLSTSLVMAALAGAVALVLVGVMGVGSASGRGRGLPPVFWGGGGGRGGGFGGGFRSGGGGDFGGGGASGGW